MRNILRKFLKDESGTTAIEYALIAVLVGLAIIAGATALGTSLNAKFADIANHITTGK